MRRSILSLAVATATAMLTLTACGGSGSAEPPGEVPQDLVVARAENFTTLNADTVSGSREGSETLELIADSLFDVSPKGVVEPMVASEYTYSSDHTALTITLRDGVTFTDGKPVTSADVKFTIENAKKGPLQGALYATITSIDTPDPKTVVLHYEEANSGALIDLAGYQVAIIPDNFGGKSADDFWLSPVTVGPFKIASWTQGKDIKLVPNDSYYGTKPKLSSVTFVGVPDENTRLLQLQNGTAQLVDSISPAQVTALKGDESVTIEKLPSAANNFLTLNAMKPPLNDVHARRAISLAINREDLVKVALQGLGQPGGSFIVPSALGGYSPPFGSRTDVAEAKSELAQSKSPDGFTFDISYDSASPSGVVAALQVVQEQLAAIGITANLDALDNNALSAKVESGDWGAVVAGIVAGGDAGGVLQYYSATNGFYSGDQEMMDLVAGLYAKANADFGGPDSRIAIFREAVDAVAESAVQIALFDDVRLWAASKKIVGIDAADATGAIDFTKVSLTN